MARAKPKTKGKDNRIVGFRLFYKRCPFNYSKKEFLAEQRHRDCICTADCTDADKADRDQANGDSGRESDRYSRSCIHLGEYEACKAAEVELKLQHNNKCVKHPTRTWRWQNRRHSKSIMKQIMIKKCNVITCN
eukprot:12696490-Ditylum_brightwellii.AAC.1